MSPNLCRTDDPAVIVAGHTGCGGCIAAWGAPPSSSQDRTDTSALSRFLDPLVRLRDSLPAGHDLDTLTRENVKMSVRNVIASEVNLSTSYLTGHDG